MENFTNETMILARAYDQCTFTNGILIRFVGSAIFCIGIISTFLSIYVFTRKELRQKSCCFYFLVLAISDLIHLTTMIIEHLPHSFHIDLIVIHSILCKTIIFLIYFSNHLSNLVLTFASIDRFVLIYCPSRSKRFCKIRYARRFVLLAIIVLLISNGHLLYGYEKLLISHGPSVPVMPDCNIPPEKALYSRIFHYYDSYIESIFFVLIPFIVMSISSLLIIAQIFETRKAIFANVQVRKSIREKRQRRLRDKDVQLCFMLIGTSFAFLLLCLPAEINDTFTYMDHERTCFHWSRKVILMLMQQIYYAGHFYIYTLTGEIFRQHLYAILCFPSVRQFFRTSTSSANDQDHDLLEKRRSKDVRNSQTYFDGSVCRSALVDDTKLREDELTNIPAPREQTTERKTSNTSLKMWNNSLTSKGNERRGLP